jgi:mono/diheme cytochrome c family protein
MSCHGANLEGDFGPNLTKVGSRLSKDQITAQITNGGGDMPAQGKNVAAADIEILAAWLAGMK